MIWQNIIQNDFQRNFFTNYLNLMSVVSGEKQAKTSSKSAEDKKFSSTIITNFFNNYFKGETVLVSEDPNAAPVTQHLTFKNFPVDDKNKQKSKDKSQKPPPKHNVIDLNKYDGLKTFVETFNNLVREKPSIDMFNVVDLTFDVKLRACLDIVEKFKPNGPERVLQTHLIPQLGFSSENVTTIQSFINAINEFFENIDKIKTKIYNTEFPHSVHDDKEPEKGVNVIYLQHISKFHDEILNWVINDGIDDSDIMLEIQRKFSMEPEYKGLTDLKERQHLQTQLLNPDISSKVLNPPLIDDPKHDGKKLVDPKWCDNLRPVEKNKSGLLVPSSIDKLTPIELHNVKALVRELNIVASFLKILRGGHKAKPEIDLKQCLSRYNHVFAKSRQFYESHKKLKDDSYESFLKYFVEAVRFIKSEFNYKTPLKTFINDLKPKVQLKFNKKLRAAIEELVKADKITDDDINRVAAAHKEEWMYISSPKTYDVNELSIYAKIGKFAEVNVTKEFRIAIGIAIVMFIQEQIALIRAAEGKRKEVVIYFKV